jgi:hypothetical protein
MAVNPFLAFSDQPAKDAASAYTGALNQGYAGLANLYAQGRGDIQNYYGQAQAPWQSLLGDSTKGWQAYADASGANGPEGVARAQAAFKTDPGYQFALNQSLDAMNRAGVARGESAGNIARGAGQYAAGDAAQQYANYVQRLQPFLQQRDVATGGLSGVLTGEGGALAGIDVGQGNAYLGVQKDIGGAQAQAAMAPYTAAANEWNLAGNLLNTGLKFASLPGGGGGGGWNAISNFFAGPQGQSGNPYGGSPATNPNLRPYG